MAAGAVAYSPRAGVLATVFRCSGSAVTRVLCTGDFWVFYGIHIFLFGVFKLGMTEYYLGDQGGLDFLKYDWKSFVHWEQLEISLYICTFTSVFFLWQCSQLYLELDELMRRMLSEAYDSAFLLRSYIQPAGCPPYDRVACRWLVTTVLLFFHEARHGCVDKAGWGRLVEFKLVTQEEADFLSELTDGQRFLVMMHCVADVAKTGLQMAGVPPNVESDVVRRLLRYGKVRSTLMDTLRNPIPYSYFHLMKLMVLITLLLWGFGAATTDCWFAPLFYFVLVVFFMGVTDIAYQMKNPFMNDDADVYLSFWVTEFLQNFVVLVELDLGLVDGWRLLTEPESLARARLSQKDMHDMFGHEKPAHLLPPGARGWHPKATAAEALGSAVAANVENARVETQKSQLPSLPLGGLMAPPQDEQRQPLLTSPPQDEQRQPLLTSRSEDAAEPLLISRSEEFPAIALVPAEEEQEFPAVALVLASGDTTLIAPGSAGDKTLSVASESGFAPGDNVLIAGDGLQEMRRLTSLDPLALDAPLINQYPFGASVSKVAHGGVLAQPRQIVPPPVDSEYVASDFTFDPGAPPADVERWGEGDPRPMDVLGSKLAERQETPTFADVGAQTLPELQLGTLAAVAEASRGPAASPSRPGPSSPAGASHGAAAADDEPEFAPRARQPPWAGSPARSPGSPGFAEISRAGDDLRSCAATWQSKDRENCTAFNAPLDALTQFLQQQQQRQTIR